MFQLSLTAIGLILALPFFLPKQAMYIFVVVVSIYCMDLLLASRGVTGWRLSRWWRESLSWSSWALALYFRANSIIDTQDPEPADDEPHNGDDSAAADDVPAGLRRRGVGPSPGAPLPATQRPRKRRQFIIGLHPHGVHAMGGIVFLDAHGPIRQALRLTGDCYCCVASVLFMLPVVRELALLANFRDCSKVAIGRLLDSGDSPMIVTGGSQEAVMGEFGRDRLYLSRRTGFVKLAIERGVPLLPSYTFGNADLYHTWNVCTAWRQWLVSKLQVAIVFFAGRWGTGTPLPNQLTVAVGRVVPVPVEALSAEEAAASNGKLCPPGTLYDDSGRVRKKVVEEVHAAYVQELQRLFEAHKEAAGYPPHRKLEIV